jgi:hypothetical protein
LIIYTAACFLGAFLYDWFTIESKGKTKDQLDQLYVGKEYGPCWWCLKHNKTVPVFQGRLVRHEDVSASTRRYMVDKREMPSPRVLGKSNFDPKKDAFDT